MTIPRRIYPRMTPIIDQFLEVLAMGDLTMESSLASFPASGRSPRRWRISDDIVDAIAAATGQTRDDVEHPESVMLGKPMVIDKTLPRGTIAIEPVDGGRVVVDEFLESVRRQYTAHGPYRDLFPPVELVPLTASQRLSQAIWDLRRRIAYAIYPFTEGDGDD